MTTNETFTEIQTILKNVASDGCYLLSLFSIADEASQDGFCKHYGDFFRALKTFLQKQWITQDMFVNNPIAILEYLTDKKWTQTQLPSIPSDVSRFDYTIVCYKWKFTHFRRRAFDTLAESQTVKNGKIEKVYKFTIKVD